MAGTSIFLLSHQERFIQSPACFPEIRWHFLLGGYGCLKGDSLIYTPSGTIPFEKFPGGKVLAVNKNGDVVTAHADTPVKLGKSPMVRVTMSDGTYFDCSLDHKFKTDKGWTTVSSLIRNHWCTSKDSACPEESISDIYQKGLHEDVQHYLQTTLGCQGDCSTCCRQCGERLPLESGNGQVSLPSQDGADEHNHNHKDFHQDFSVFDALKMDDALPSEGYIRLYQFYPRDGQCGNTPQSVVLGEEGYAVVHNAEAIFVESPVFEIPHDYTCPQNTVDEFQSLSDDKSCHVLSGQDRQYSLSRNSFDYLHIKSIDFIGGYVKYDMTVATEHNYIANGYIHHNCGKTSSLVMATLKYVSELQNVKDDAGKYARIMVGGYTYAHLEQTFMIDFLTYLDQSKTPYRNDTKNHIMYIGTVQIIFVQLSEPDRVFGQSIYCFVNSTKILTKDKEANILEVSIEDVSEGDEVLTRQGWKKVTAVHDNGYKEVMRVGKALCTPDHRFATGSDWVEAQNITPETPLWKYNLKEVELCQKLEDGANRLSQTLKNLTGSYTTDTQGLSLAVKESITGVRTIKRIMWHYGKSTMDLSLTDTVYTILTATHLIMRLVICRCLQSLNTTNCTEKLTDRRDTIRLLNTARQCLKQLKHEWQMLLENVPAGIVAQRIKECIRQGTVLMSAVKQQTKSLQKHTQCSVKSADVSSLLNLPRLCSAANSVEMLGLIRMEKLLTMCVKQGNVSSVAKSLSALDKIKHKLAHLTAKTSREGRLYHVYDLTVEDCHEFFADGVLVHNCAILDEIDELPEDIMIEAMKSVSQRCRQKLIGQRSCHIISASTAQGYKGFYRLYTNYKKRHIAFVLTRAWTEDNIYLPPEYIEDLKKSFTDTEREVFMHGEFLSVAQGRVIPGFDWNRNYVDEEMDNRLKPGEKVFIGMDFNTGYNRASAWISRMDENGVGVMMCVKTYDFPDALEAPNVFRYDFPEQNIFWLPDVTSKDSFPQFARALRQNNIHIIYRTKSPLVEDSCFFISSMCYQGRVKICRGAEAIAEAFAQASRDKQNKIPKGVGESSPIHYIDGARYATCYMGLVLPEYKDIRRSLITHIASMRKDLDEDDDADVKKVGGGYTQIEGSAYLR